MMKALTHNIRQEREDQRDRSAQLFMWCIVVSMHQDDGIGASRLLRACNEMDAFEKNTRRPSSTAAARLQRTP